MPAFAMLRGSVNSTVQTTGGIFVDMWRKKEKRQRRWDRIHIRSATCRIPEEDYVHLKIACFCDGLTVNRLLRSFVAWYLKREYGERGVSDSLQFADVVMREMLTHDI